jgi:hypothetical protein
MRDKSNKGAWAVIRYLPFDTSEGELPAHFDGWFTNRDGAEAIAEDWATEYPEATVVVVVQPGRFLAAEGEQQNSSTSPETGPVSTPKRKPNRFLAAGGDPPWIRR